MSFYEKINFALWRRIYTLPNFFVERWQVIKLRHIVNTAYSIGVYRDFWDKAGANPKAIRQLKDIARLPVMNKDILRRFLLNARYNRSARPHVVKQTSGSTGEPFRFPFNHPGYAVETASGRLHLAYYLFRPLERRGIDITSVKAAFLRVNASPHMENPPLAIFLPEMREDPASALNKLREFGPTVVWGIPTLFTELASQARSLSADKIPHFPFAISSSEKLNRAQRKLIESIFKTEVYDCYGTEEMRNIAIECEYHSGLHVYEESFAVEILDENDKPLPPGTLGRIVVTNFYNDIFPFIRYDTGDCGKILAGVCPCGLSTKRLLAEGRVSGFLSFDAKKFHYFELEKVLLAYSRSILRYQLAKINEKAAELRIIPADKFTQSEVQKLCTDYRNLCGVNVNFKIVNGLPISPRGKTPVFVDESGAN